MSARYFTKPGEGIQEVYNLRDDKPYLDDGYVEVDEATYLASLPTGPAEPADLPDPSGGVS